jgi:hypothetical protein
MEKTENRHFVASNQDVYNSAPWRELINDILLHEILYAMTPREISDSHKAYF